MKNVLYSACWADPWILVAKKLQDEHQLNPVCWVGYEADGSERAFKNTFGDDIYFQRYFEAWRGEFPNDIASDIDEHISESFLDIDFLKRIAAFELQAMTMMDRMDSDRHSFPFMERQRHFRRLLRQWDYLLDKLKVDVVISATVPHRVYDYVIYLLCKKKGIPFIAMRETAFIGRIICVDNIVSIDPKIAVSDAVVSIDKLPDDILKNLSRLHGNDYKDAEPSYMKQHGTNNQSEQRLLGNFKKMVQKVGLSNKSLLGKNGILTSGFSTYHKRRGMLVEESTNPIWTNVWRKITAIRYKKALKQAYESVCQPFDKKQKYVFFAMHYQPEMTSNPAGDIFADQLLCIEALLESLPDDYLIYVKEHKSQFYSHVEGHTARMAQFYKDANKHKRVCFIPLEVDAFELIDNAEAISTVTGTVGWEALAKEKPVVIFGMAWYENFPGVFKVTSSQDIESVHEFILSYSFNEQSLLSYLYSLESNSTVAYYLRGIKPKIDLSEEDCVNNLTRFILSKLNEKSIC